MFPISWSVFGLAVVAMLLAITYGPGVFVIKLPQINISIDILTTLITAFGAAGATLASYLQYRSNKRELELDIASAQMSQRALSEARQDVEVEQDVKIAFIRRAIELEDVLRRIAHEKAIPVDQKASATKIAKELNVRGVLTSDVLKLLIAIWEIRNKTVHGYEVPNSVARRGLELVEDLLDSLKRLMNASS